MNQAGDDIQTLTLAWHKVSEDDGSICELSVATERMVEQASEELRQALASNNVRIAVETLTPEKVAGAECLCNRVLVQGRYVDEWLGAELVKTECSGCPNQARCGKTAETDGCGGQYAMIHQGKTYSVVPANLITMAGMVAAAELTGEEIAYGGHPCGGCKCGKCQDGCKCGDCEHGCKCGDCEHGCKCGECEHGCKCGECKDGCKQHTAGAPCSPDCPGMATGATPNYQAGGGVAVTKSPAPATKKSGCPRAANCKNAGCPSKASGS
jgi:hypothetical protein